MPRIAMQSRRSRPSCSVIAMATVLAVGATPAAGQSFNGTGSFAVNGGGSANITPGAGTTNIQLNPGQTVINWTPTDNATNTTANIVFQNADTTATFFTSSGDFAVLNNINSASINRAIEMNGTVNARVGGVNGVQRGSVYFYAPGGFVFGGGSVFNVGSLVISALPIAYDTNGFITNFGTQNTVQFNQAPNPNAAIVSQGTIDAQFVPFGVGSAGSSYVAMVAPRVDHRGSIVVKGSAALVGAEEATINFSPDGLFDIEVTVGTDDDNGVAVSGDIGGIEPSATEQKRVYLVAVPKNDALTMVISNGADLGFELANNASIDQYGAVVLSAGHDILNGDIGAESAASNAPANFWFTGAHATNNLFGEATGYADLYSVDPNLTTTFDSDVTVHAVEHIFMNASGAEASLTVGGNLDLSTSQTGGVGESVTAGDITLQALNGATVSVGGTTTLSADATGGNAASGTAGSGTGGEIWVSADDGGMLTLQSVTGTAHGSGGDGLAAGVHAGQGTGGTLRLYGDDASTVVVGAVSFDAKGTGGDASGAGLAGTGQGGNAYVYIGDDSFVTINGATTLKSDGQGGAHASGSGGMGFGGESRVTSVVDSLTNGLLTFNGNVELSSDGTGGASDGSGTGGTGTGGWARISTPLGSVVDLNGTANLHANGTGGDSEAGNGGLGQGGLAEIESLAGNIDISGAVTLLAGGLGGQGLAEGTHAGDGVGGDINIRANAGTSVTFQSHVVARADGDGGLANPGVNGGDGTGGDINVSANGTGGTLTFQQGADIFADGEGSSPAVLECLICSAIGGDGFGGTVTFTGTSGGMIDATGFMELSATGSGGSGGSGAAGNGTGGTVLVHAPTGVTMDFTGELQLNGSGDGGFSELGNAAGNGNGNSARLHVDGGSVTVTGDIDVDADGFGGESGGGGAGGSGTGGFAEILTTGATAELNVIGNVLIEADGTGGDSFNFNEVANASGNGGAGTGGIAQLVSESGNIEEPGIDISGNAAVSATGTGGFAGSGTGGTGTGRNAEIRAISGALSIGGMASVDTSGSGGDGLTGGNGIGGGETFEDGDWIDGAHLIARNGSIAITGATTVNAQGTGGAGSSGGAGGSATGGYADVRATNSDLGPSSITLSTLNASASATGGDGGDGTSGNQGGNGGAGGHAQAGDVTVFAHAGNGHLTVTTVNGTAIATGGSGGDGGNGDNLAGGSGGDGGNAVGGHVQVGTASGSGQAAASNLGTGTYGSISADASATGGAGGDGSFGSPDGSGGNGGTGDGGRATLLVRGSTVTVTGATQLIANGQGGNGGFGGGELGGEGAGGDGFAGEIAVVSTSRYLIPAQHGTLSTGSITGTAAGIGGLGSTDGSGIVEGGSSFEIDSSMVDIDSLDFDITGDTVDPAADASFIRITNATVEVDSAFAFSTIGDLSFYIDRGSLGTALNPAGSLVLSAGDFVPDAVLDEPANRGTAFADTASITTGNNFIADADFVIGGSLLIDAPGLIDAHNFTIDGDLELFANGNITIGNADATESVELDAGGNVLALNLTAGDSVDVEAGGSVNVGDLSAGIVNPSNNEGADYVVTILAGGNIVAGSIEAAQHIGLATPGTITAETIEAGGIFMALGTGNMLFGDASAGSDVYLADFSMMELGGGDITDEFDPNPILASAPTPTGGSITIGDVNTGRFAAAAGTSLTTGLIDSDSEITLDASGAISTGNLFAGDFVLANGGSITTGNIEAESVDMTSTGGNITTQDINAFGAVALDAFGNILTGDIFAGSIDLLAGGDITTDNLTTQQLVLLSDGITIQELFPGASITLQSGGDISTDNIDSVDGVYLEAGGSITTGDIEAFDFIWAFAGTDMDLGNLDAGEDIDLESGFNLESGGNMAFDDANAGTEFDFEAGGNVTGGAIVAGATIEGEAAGTVTLGNLTAGFDPGEFVDDDTFSVGIQAAGAISVGNVQGAERVGFATFGNLTTGSIQAGWDFLAFSDGNIVTGAITTGEGDQVFMSGTDLFLEAGGGEDSEFNPDEALAENPTATGGSITINGPVNTGWFRAAAGTTLTTQAVNAEDANAFAGGLAVINGAWNVGDAKIISNDIDITANGSIAADGDISLVSKNATRTVVGDGLNLSGYNLSGVEFNKLSANDVTIMADTAQGAAPTMFIGSLNASASGFPEGIDYEFLTGNGDTEVASGTIRVAGNAVFTGMTSENHSVGFGTGLFELVTEIGSISLFSSGSTLGGVLGISADRVHVASASTLNQLASNPTYTNYQQDLNETPDVQRPEGVLRADTISIESDNLQDVLIQNTGTGFQGGTPAGFLARQLLISGGEGAGSINLVINGQVVTEGGTVTGVAARDALITEETDITPFTGNSTINGCPLTGACIIPPPPPPPSADVVDSQIDLITGDNLGDGEFGNEDDIDDNEQGDEAANNPINPPQPLFDTRPLIPGGDVNDPVSGTGNPALLGSDQQCEEDEQGQCPANPVKGDSQ